MDELDGNVLRVGSVRTSPECQQPPAVEKTLGHLPASHRERTRLFREEAFENPVPFQQPVLDVHCRNV